MGNNHSDFKVIPQEIALEIFKYLPSGLSISICTDSRRDCLKELPGRTCEYMISQLCKKHQKPWYKIITKNDGNNSNDLIHYDTIKAICDRIGRTRTLTLIIRWCGMYGSSKKMRMYATYILEYNLSKDPEPISGSLMCLDYAKFVHDILSQYVTVEHYKMIGYSIENCDIEIFKKCLPDLYFANVKRYHAVIEQILIKNSTNPLDYVLINLVYEHVESRGEILDLTTITIDL